MFLISSNRLWHAGVLVAISIPIFTAQLEKSREATDLANLRSAYAAVMAAGLTETSSDDIAKANTDKIKYGNDRPGPLGDDSTNINMIYAYAQSKQSLTAACIKKYLPVTINGYRVSFWLSG